jgi:PAS domain-containing protein
LFANAAFAEMLGRDSDEILSLKFRDVFHKAPVAESALSVVNAAANKFVELRHRNGSIVRAVMSRSALMRSDDRIALAAFHDLTEQLWLREP